MLRLRNSPADRPPVLARAGRLPSGLALLLLALALGAGLAVLGLARAADPGSKDDPLATLSYVQRYSSFTRHELAAGQILLLRPGAELVIADSGGQGLEFAGLDPLRDALLNLSAGEPAASATLLPYAHYVNASTHELKLKPARAAVLLLRGDWR
jgi:hypothetical protein